jgi:5-formyltetrahydrofolate cyclo-ligase
VRLDDEKIALRTRMRHLRSALPEPLRERLSAAAVERLLALPELERASTAFVFRSFGSEISTIALLDRLADRGVRLALPVLRAGTLEAVTYRPGDPLVPSGYGPMEPRERTSVSPAKIDLVVAPGLAFDPLGYRLGYGGGYYDAFLRDARVDAARVGLGFDLQVVTSVPHGERDQRLDMVVTDARVLRR